MLSALKKKERKKYSKLSFSGYSYLIYKIKVLVVVLNLVFITDSHENLRKATYIQK